MDICLINPDCFCQHLPENADSFSQTLFLTVFVNIRCRIPTLFVGLLYTVAYRCTRRFFRRHTVAYHRIPLHATVFCTAASRFCAAA
jgi:hypothetical protein